MTDITTFSTYDILPEARVINCENIELKKSNKALKGIIIGTVVLILSTGIIIYIKKEKDAAAGK